MTTKYCDIHGAVEVDEATVACQLFMGNGPAKCMTGLKLKESDMERNRKAVVTRESATAPVPPKDTEETSAKQMRQGAWLAAYEECGRILVASAAAGIDKRTYFRWMKEPDFAAAFAISEQIATQHLEDHAVKLARGLDGATTSERLLIKLLEAKRPEVYARPQRHEHQGPGGGPMELETLEVSSRDEFTSRIVGLASRAAAPATDSQPD
jgi:hypothetical protein